MFGIHQPGRLRQAERAEHEVERPVERVEDPEPDQRIGDVGHDRRQEHGHAVEPVAAPPLIEEQRQRERAEHPQRHGERDEDRGILHRDLEDALVKDVA